MKELNSSARALLRATEGADDPTEEDFDRVHAGVTARLAAGVAVGAAVTAGAKTAAASAAGASAAAGASVAAAPVTTGLLASLPVLKVVALVVAASMTIGVGSAVVVSRSRAEDLPHATIATAPRPTASPVATPGARHDEGPPSAVAAEPPPAPLPATPAPTVRMRASGAAMSSGASLEAETGLIRDARLAIQHGDAARALAFLDDHLRRFPDGSLAVDRDALQVFATCDAGQGDAARELAARFLAKHTASSYAAAVRAACAPGAPGSK